MRGALAIVASALAITAACSTFDSNDGASPAPDGGDAEAGASADSGGEPSEDAGTPRDGSCTSPGHLVCDDFASEVFPSPVWDGKDEGLPGGFALSTAKSTSPPRSLLVTLAGDSGSSSGHAQLKKNIPPQLRKLTCALSVYPESLGAGGADGSYVFGINLTGNAVSGIATVNGALGLHSDFTAFNYYSYPGDGGQPDPQGTNAQAIPLGRWTRLSMVIDLDKSTLDVSIVEPAATLLSWTLPANLTSHNGGSMWFGINGATVETRFFLDDIVCDMN